MNKQTAPSRRRLMATGVVVVALAAVGAAWLVSRASVADAKPAPSPAAAVPVTVLTMAERPVDVWQAFSGRLEAVERVKIRARVMGTIQSVHFREGSLVKAGDLLITIDPAPYAAEVDRAEAQVVAARARVAFTKSELARAERLWKVKAIAERELDERRNAGREAAAQLRAAEAALRTARLDLGYTRIKAPVSGRVGRLEVTVGNLVAAGPDAPVLTTLVSVSPIYASFDADEGIVAQALQEAPRDPAGHPKIEAIPVRMQTAVTGDTPLEGHLQLVDNQVDAASGTVRLRAIFDNPDGVLMPGQFARVRMGSSVSHDALLINERSVGTDQDKKFVLVVDNENHAQYREVTLGASVAGERVVTAGLAAGDRVVASGWQRIRPGALVDPKPAGDTTPAEGR
ncbi:efflux RND transporter periplasmic adaptor subunit [Nitrogeniibacter mangrovi]|uniref:Efflux RND transporter periplasmic adaptor subunit n=1 Tax=Nitrogeniibacter mangrovi TaxID=2016596 RepID=A0A6C1B560_9RHOO|nr:efflux RND transporter periplasmic adaptor subunit [Nitrogeniibacter mangrovi]QID17908.1 efflux RND transporter periplasmic adaptor subunit [Nitrogeniibacter mangrovi]